MFGIDLIDANLLPAMLIALLGGLLSFASPCVLPIVPPYLAYMSGITVAEIGGPRRSAVPAAFCFVLGLSTVFLLMGFAASALGGFFIAYAQWFTWAASLVIMLFGLHFLGILRLPFLMRDLRMDAGDRGGTVFGAYILGLAFAFGWTPCIGPQLGAILTLAANTADPLKGMVLLGVYAFGLGIPFIIVAAFLPRLGGALGFFKRHMEAIERLMGLLLWTVGLMMLSGGFADMSFWLQETFPALGSLG